MTRSQASRSFAADPSQLEVVRRFVSTWADTAGLSEDSIDDIVLAVNEAASNSIVHSGSKRFHIRWLALEDRVEIEIRDEGVFRKRVRLPQLEESGGLGIPLMMSVTDGFELHEGTSRRPGTRTRLIKFSAGSSKSKGPVS